MEKFPKTLHDGQSYHLAQQRLRNVCRLYKAISDNNVTPQVIPPFAPALIAHALTSFHEDVRRVHYRDPLNNLIIQQSMRRDIVAREIIEREVFGKTEKNRFLP